MWAESGECEVNPGFMIGTKTRPGDCLASCGRCDLLPAPFLGGATRRLLKAGAQQAHGSGEGGAASGNLL